MLRHPQASRRVARLRSRAGLIAATITCVVTGGVALLASGRAWVSFTVAQPPLPQLHGAASGHVVAGAAAPLALVVLAGVVAFPATRKLGRRVAALLVALAGLGLVVTAVQVAAAPRHAVAEEAARLTGRTGVRPDSASLTAWPWVVVAMGALALAVGVASVVYARDWPAMGRRYEAAAPRSGGQTSMWDTLDRGDDPTV